MSFNINENLVVESLDKIPEDYRPFYKETEDGKHKLDSEDPKVKVAVAHITKLSTALKAERGAKKVDLTPLKEFGESPEEILASINTRITEAKASGDKDGQKALEAAKAAIVEANKTQLAAKDGEITTLNQQLYDLTVVNAATTAISNEKGMVDLLMPFIKQGIKVIKVDGKVVPRVVDAQGEIRYSGHTGEPMSILELVKEMKGNAQYAPLFHSEAGGGGSGSRPGAAQQKPNANNSPTNNQKDKTSTEKIAAGLSKLKKA